MKSRRGKAVGGFDGLGRKQLLFYAQELGESFRQMRGLRGALTEREQQIREMAAASIAAQEDEREWIAYEVHDRIAQTLASAFHQLQALEALTREDESARQVAVRASVLLREAIRESRNIMNDLHPPVLDEFGVDPLITEELRHFREEKGCQTTYEASYESRPPRDVEVALYRIFHEALINVGRHAPGAQSVAVALTSNDGRVTLEVKDNGRGFDVDSALQVKRLGGLMSMRRRAEIIGGELRIESRSGIGTTVSVNVPVNVSNEWCNS